MNQMNSLAKYLGTTFVTNCTVMTSGKKIGCNQAQSLCFQIMVVAWWRV